MSELRELILQENSKSHAVFLAHVLKERSNYLPEFLEIIYAEEEPVSRRAAWALRTLFDDDKRVLLPFIDDMIMHLEGLKSAAVLRAFLAIISMIDIDEKWHGFLIQYCSEIILNSQSEIAVKAFAMDIFFQISKTQQELFYELEQMIDFIYPDGSRGIQNKCRNMTKWIEKARASAHK